MIIPKIAVLNTAVGGFIELLVEDRKNDASEHLNVIPTATWSKQCYMEICLFRVHPTSSLPAIYDPYVLDQIPQTSKNMLCVTIKKYIFISYMVHDVFYVMIS